MPINIINQAIGEVIENFTAGEKTNINSLEVHYCRLERLCTEHYLDNICPESLALQWIYLPMNALPGKEYSIIFTAKSAI
ncbi:hypothetical protein [Gallibacterium genomosp. 1]|uniref:hypothetical protein n=1 Tax=Gallibacterium genomosp. 1 TaxID=155515 RepID=UPI000A7928BB|nr:hypothetical protein [Gallibacterium genomosp. 1]